MRRPRSFLRLDRLETRLTPAVSATAPLQFGANLWSPIAGPKGQLDAQLNYSSLVQLLSAAPAEHALDPIEIDLPRPDGSFDRFDVWEFTMMTPDLAAHLPTVHTYRGQGIDAPGDLLAADVGPNGFHARVVGPGTIWSIDPTQGYYVSEPPPINANEPAPNVDMDDGLDLGGITGLGQSTDDNDGGIMPFVSGDTLRIYRLAVASTGEYTAFSGGSVTATQANIVTLINRINLTLERDFCSRLMLINNTSIIYTDASTDPYTGDDPGSMVNENQTNLDSVIGTANYDIGHVFSAGSPGTGEGGEGYFRAIDAPWKAGGATIAPTWDTPIGVPFEENVTHEFGHQYGALHDFNGVNGAAEYSRNGPTAVEVGSGSSIMSYPGICGPDDLQETADLYYASITYDQVEDFLSTLNGVGSTMLTGDTAPTVYGGLDATIPADTPFALTATASDPDGDTLTYSWEERDLGAAQALGSPDNGESPLFRLFAPVSSPTRYFPDLTDLLAGTPSKGETLPTTNRDLNFLVMVRDNHLGGGGVNEDDVTLHVVNTGSAFAVTSPNTAVSLPGGSSQLITWNVAGTSGSAINAQYVNILLSTDGGLTFPTTLAANTPNDGSEAVVLPTGTTSTARIKIQPVGNYFFAISDVNFSITAAPAMQVTSTTPAAGSVVSAPFTQLDVTFTQPITAATISTSNLNLSQGTVTAAVLQSSNVARYTLAGITSEGTLTVMMPANAVSSAAGGNAQFYETFAVDAASSAFPTPLTAASPLGSLVYTGSATGTVNTAANTDAFTLNLDAGQTISITAAPGSTLRPSVQLTGPGGVNISNSAASAGQTAVIEMAAIAQGGTYTMTVSSPDGSTGNYTLGVILNAAVDVEPNNSIATAQSIAGSGFDLGGGSTRWAIMGQTDGPTLPVEIESNNTAGTANDASLSFAPYSGNLYQLGFGATMDYNIYKLGTFQPGDLITQAQYGADSDRGTQADPIAYFYYDANGYYLGYDDNSGPGHDALFYRFNVDYNDVYYGAASGYYLFGDTIQMGYLLENVSTPPLTGGTFVNSEPNQTIDTATDVSSDWRPVQYRSSVAGNISSGGDTDYYSYQFTAGDLVTFEADSTSNLDAAITLRNPGGTILATDPGDGGGLSSQDNAYIYAYVIPTTGTYTVQVSAHSGAGGAYNLISLLSTNTPPPTPADYSSFNLLAGQTVTLALKDQSAGSVNLDLVNASDTVLAIAAAGPTNYDKVLTYTAPSAGTYYARIGGDAGVNYVLTATTATVDSEPNDTFAIAQPLTNGRALGATVSANDDWYSFTANAGQLITLTTTTPAGGTGQFVNNDDPLIELYSPSDTLLASDDNSGGGVNAKLLYQATAAGTYRVRVRGTTGEYTLTETAVVDAPPNVSTLVIGDGTPQRSRVTSLTVTFSEPVTLPANPANAFQLVRQSPAATVTLAANMAGQTATLTFTGGPVDFSSLADGRYTLTIFANMVSDSAGQPLDGNGDGTFGDNYQLVGNPATNKLFRLYGDADGNGTVDANDFLQFRLAFLQPSAIFDFDNNGSVDAGDFLQFRLRFLMTI